jgi:glycine/D-amino acid oxidase-like deaminating enzyme
VIFVALLIAAGAVPQTPLDAADQTDEAYVRCLFAASRAASAAHLSPDEFARKLSSACRNEEDAVVRTGTAVLARRGDPNAAAKARQSAQEARQSVLDTYRRFEPLSR